MPTTRILGLDPGTNSFAYSVLEVSATRTTASALVLQRGFILSTVHDLRSAKFLRIQQQAFEGCIRSVADQFTVSHVVAERYQSRGMGGATIEHVNIMLGMLLSMKLGPTRIFPASQWKNELTRRGFILDEVYAEFKGVITPHEIDASHIGWYGANALCGGRLPFTGILESAVASPHVGIVADVSGHGELDTTRMKREASKEKGKGKRKKARK